MRVLVWQEYGNTKVFAAETVEDYQVIAGLVNNAMGGWDEDEKLEELGRKVMTDGVNNSTREKAIKDVVTPSIRTHETFEVFEFMDVQ